jgi:hypothetical protein
VKHEYEKTFAIAAIHGPSFIQLNHKQFHSASELRKCATGLSQETAMRREITAFSTWRSSRSATRCLRPLARNNPEEDAKLAAVSRNAERRSVAVTTFRSHVARNRHDLMMVRRNVTGSASAGAQKALAVPG